MQGQIHIFGGGTFSPVRNHLSLAAQAFGEAAHILYREALWQMGNIIWADFESGILPESYGANFDRSLLSFAAQKRVTLHLTRMAGGPKDLMYNEDVAALLNSVLTMPSTKMIVMNAALCDYTGSILEYGDPTPSGPHETRLKTSEGSQEMVLMPADKLIGDIRKKRPDVFVVGFKTTTKASLEEQRKAGYKSLLDADIQLVLANDTVTRQNVIVGVDDYATPTYVTGDRHEALSTLVKVALNRCAIFQAPAEVAGF